MKDKLFLFTILLGLVSFACNRKAPETVNISRVLIDLDNLKPIAFSELFSEAELSPLETTDSCLLGIVYPKFDDNYYFVRDNMQQMAAVFNKDGSFRFKIANQGAGPEQYRHMNEIVYNPFSQKLLLIENHDYIHEYDLSGKLTKKIRIDSLQEGQGDVIPINKDTLLIISGHDFVTYNFYSCKENRMLNRIKDPAFHMNHNKFYHYGKDNFLFKSFDNTVYKVSDTTMIPAYYLDFGVYNHKQKDYAKLFQSLREVKFDEDKFGSILSQNFSFIVANVQENKKYIFMKIRKLNQDIEKLQILNIVYNKSLEQAYSLDIENDKIVWNNWMSRLTDDYYVTYMNSHDRDELSMSILSEASKSIFNGLTDDGNPVIIKYKFK